MKSHLLFYLLTALLNVVSITLKANITGYDISVKNSDGKTIFYNYIGDGTELEVTSGVYAYTGSIVIPENVIYMNNVLKVTGVGKEAFYGESLLSSVTIPNTVRYIDNYAFMYCIDLKSISLGKSLTSIGYYAFGICEKLTSISIPNSFASIGEYAFRNCSSLKSVTIGSSVESIGYFAFEGCVSITSIKSLMKNPAMIVGNTLGSTFPHETYNTATLYIPKGTMNNYRFTEGWKDFVNIEEFIPETDTTGKCGDNLMWDYSDATKTLTISGTGEMFNYETNFDVNNPSPWNNLRDVIENVTIESGVSTIGNYAFSSCINIKEITLSNSIINVGDYAFDYCTGLTSVHISDLKTWFNISFSGIYSNPLLYAKHLYVNGEEMKYLIIPNDLTVIPDYAFVGCSGLTSVIIPDGVTDIGNCAFYGCDGLISLDIPHSVKNIGNYAIKGCTALTSIIIPNSVEKIGSGAFEDCGSITKINIPNSVTEIGENTFCGCANLSSVTIGNKVSILGDNLFTGCNSLTSITVDKDNKTYDSRDKCNAIIETSTNTLIFGCQNTVVPNTVTSIGNYAFYSCHGLATVNIPKSVTNIGDCAFTGCQSLSYVNIPSSVIVIGNQAFSYCTELNSVSIPNSVTNIDYCTFEGCTGLTSVTIPNSVNTIGWHAFYGCSSLKEVILGKGLDNIGNSAFEGCYELSDVYSYAEVVPQSNGNIFSSLDKSSTLHVPLSSINSYKSTEFGTAFGNIVPLTDSDPSPTGIKLIEKSIDEKVIIYDLNGRQIRQQQKGIYITNGKKLAVK